MTDQRKELPCVVVRDLLPLYHDGVVSSETCELIEDHLDTCEDCRGELNSIRSDDMLSENLIEHEKDSSFKEFRDGVSSLRRNGTVRGLLIAAAAMIVFFGGIIFFNNADIIRISPADLDIDDVCRYDFGDNGGQGLFFTYEVSWNGGWSMTFEDTGDPNEISIAVKRTLLGGKMESDKRNPRSFWIINDFYDYDNVDISKAEVVKINGQTIWSKDQGVNKKPPAYIYELIKFERDYDDPDPENRAISEDIDDDSFSIRYADNHGVKWDKAGNMIAEFTTNDDGEILTMKSVPQLSD